MQNFRQFEAGPDPFGRKFQVFFKWLQTAISIRHSDTVDVKFVLQDENGARTEKTIALPHAALLAVSAGTQRRREKLKKGPCCNASPRLGSGIRVWSPSPYPTSNATPPKAA